MTDCYSYSNKSSFLTMRRVILLTSHAIHFHPKSSPVSYTLKPHQSNLSSTLSSQTALAPRNLSPPKRPIYPVQTLSPRSLKLAHPGFNPKSSSCTTMPKLFPQPVCSIDGLHACSLHGSCLMHLMHEDIITFSPLRWYTH